MARAGASLCYNSSAAKNEKRKNMCSQWIARDLEQIGGRIRDTSLFLFSFLSSRFPFFYPLFSGVCSPRNTRRHVHNVWIPYTAIQFPLLPFSYLGHCAQELCTALCRNNVHCIFEQWEDPSTVPITVSTLFATLSVLFSTARPRFPRLLMAASGKRPLSFDFEQSRFIPASFLLKLSPCSFFQKFSRGLLFADQREPIRFDVGSPDSLPRFS